MVSTGWCSRSRARMVVPRAQLGARRLLAPALLALALAACGADSTAGPDTGPRDGTDAGPQAGMQRMVDGVRAVVDLEIHRATETDGRVWGWARYFQDPADAWWTEPTTAGSCWAAVAMPLRSAVGSSGVVVDMRSAGTTLGPAMDPTAWRFEPVERTGVQYNLLEVASLDGFAPAEPYVFEGGTTLDAEVWRATFDFPPSFALTSPLEWSDPIAGAAIVVELVQTTPPRRVECAFADTGSAMLSTELTGLDLAAGGIGVVVGRRSFHVLDVAGVGKMIVVITVHAPMLRLS
jgi:hypothetical protein